MLQSEIKDLNERFESNDLNKSQSSVIFQKIVDLSAKDDNGHEIKRKSADLNYKDAVYESKISSYESKIEAYERKIKVYESKIANYENKEENWLARETELVGLLKETTQNLKALKEEKRYDFMVFEDVLSERQVQQSLCKTKERQTSSDEERLSNALELSRERVASLISSKEELEIKVEDLVKELNNLKEKHAEALKTVERERALSKETFSKDFDKERNMLEEKHRLELEKILIIEEVCHVS